MESPKDPDRKRRVSNEDIAAFVDGTAPPALQRRVAAAAVIDAAVRERIALLRAAVVAAAEDSTAGNLPDAAEEMRLDRLRARMLQAARVLAGEAQRIAGQRRW